MGSMVRVLVYIIAMVGVGVFAYAAIAGLNALTGRLQRKGSPAHDELEQLHARVAATEALEDRILELEQRVDFAERLIAEQRDVERLSPGPRPDHR
jgi:hypothetical protein